MSTIRHITENDIESLAAAHCKSCKDLFKNDADKERLDDLNKEDFVARWEARLDSLQSLMFVAEDKKDVKGLIVFGGNRDKEALPEEGEIYMLHDFEKNGKSGLAHNLMETALGNLSYMGYTRVYAWLPKANKTYQKLFKDYGFEPDGRERIEKQEGVVFTSVHYSKRLHNIAETA